MCFLYEAAVVYVYRGVGVWLCVALLAYVWLCDLCELCVAVCGCVWSMVRARYGA